LASDWQGFVRWVRANWYGPDVPVLSPRCSTLVGRAQVANALAERALLPSDPLPFLGAEAVACELSREAIYWALLALRERETKSSPEGETSSSAPDSSTLAALWSGTTPALIEAAAGGAEAAERVHRDLVDKSFADFAELGPEQQAATARRLTAFAERLIEPLAVPQRARDLAWVRRVKFVMLTLVVLLALGFAGRAFKAEYDLSMDMAPSASWVASSRYESECTCHSPEQSCAACPSFFFCTEKESRPSIVFDLHSVRSLSAVVVDNRRDCCSGRALPLVIQVSTDQTHWKTVATRKEQFDTWRADFPTEQTRWVKLYVSRRDFLHLAKVRLLP